MNTIYKRQNNHNALKAQAAARYYYNKADRLDLFHWFGILTTILIKLLFQNNLFADFLLIIWFIAGFFFEYHINECTNLSANFKEDFDNYVMGRNNNEPSIDEDSIINDIKENEIWFKQQINYDGNGEPKGVKNWYSIKEYMNQFEAIKLSYKENIFYDSSLNKILSLFFILTISIIAVFIYFKNLPFTALVNTIFLTTASLTSKMINTIIKLYKTKELNKKITHITDYSQKIDELEKAQKYFYEKRKISGVSLGMIYNIAKHRIEKKFNNIFVDPEI